MSTVLSIMMSLAVVGAENTDNKKVEEAVKRAPLVAQQARVTEMDLSAYDKSVKIVRERSEGKTFARFSADSHLLDPGSILVFEVKSIAKTGEIPRWRCVATHDVAECLGGKGLRVRYLPNDEKIVMTARVIPRPAVSDFAIASR